MGAPYDYTWTVSPTILLNFRTGVSRMHLPWRPYSFGFDPVANLGMPSYIRELGDGIEFPGFSPTGYRKLGDGGPNFRRNSSETHPYSAHATKILSKHSIKFGGEWRFLQVHNSEYGRMNGTFNFGKAPTQGPDPTPASNAAGDGLASMLLGYGGGTFTKAFKGVSSSNRYYALYVNGNYKPTSKLTLNLGLRWAVDSARTARHNRMNWFNPDVASPLAGPAGLPNLMGGFVFVGFDGVKRAQFDTDYNNFAPRAGLAYQATQRLVLRFAYGLLYAPSKMGAGGSGCNLSYRTDTEFLGMIGVCPNHTIDDPYPDGLIPDLGSALGQLTGVGGNVNAYWQDTKIPMMHVWNFNLQYQHPCDMSIEAALTSLEVGDAEAAAQVVRHYLQRWRVEDFFRVLKSGCRVEHLAFRTADRLRRAIAINSVIAWRIMVMTLLGRQVPARGRSDVHGPRTGIPRRLRAQVRPTRPRQPRARGALGGAPTRMPGPQPRPRPREPDHVARLRHADESDTGASDWVGECPQPRNRKLTGNTLFSSTYGYMVGLACGYKAGSVTPYIFRRRLSSSTKSEVIFAIDFCP